MREIKFRWYNKTEWQQWMLKYWPQWMIVEANWRDDISVMQYTWLKDNNGKDIYEGDIISYFNPDWFEKIQEVRWDENTLEYWCGCTDLATQKYIQDKMMDSFKFNWKFDIIWNIYENPGLLTK